MNSNIKNIISEIMELYLQGKTDELLKISNDKSESAERRLAANMILQLPKDERRYK